MKSLTFFDCLALIFITLKLCDIIDWHWLLILSPLIFSVPNPKQQD